MINFTKMQGLGNDFIVIDNIDGDVSLSVEEIRRLSDRRFGIGFDQLLMVESPIKKEADFRYVIFNADGSEVSQCGNGARCLALYIRKKDLADKNPILVETNSGRLVLTINKDNSVNVEMGEPSIIPLQWPLETEEFRKEFKFAGYEIGMLSIGNPHAVLVVDDLDYIGNTPLDIERVATLYKANSGHFPKGVNVGFVQIIKKNEVRVRVVERGVGETLACGSGACAAVVHGINLGLLDPKVQVHLNGGDVEVEYHGKKVYLSGPAEFVYEGSINLRSGAS